jgi:hypothetical protein
MEHTQGQETAWGDLSESVFDELKDEYAVNGSVRHQITISRRSAPIREVILNFAGEDLFIHFEEGEPRSLPQPIRVNDDRTLWELQTGSPISKAQIITQIRTYLAA